VTSSIAKPRTASTKRTSLWLLLLCSALMLPLLFPPFYCFFLAPVALVPFAIAILRRPMKWRFAGAYYLLGAAFFLPNLFWLIPVTFGGYVGLALFVALYFPLFAWGFHRLVVQFRMPATFALPLVWTAVEYCRCTFVLGGFPWFMLGNCLTPVPVLIQAADMFGVWGLTFLICMANGLVVDLLRLPLVRGKRVNPAIIRLTAVTGAVFLGAIGYGVFRLNQHTTRSGPRVAVIQEDLPQSLKDDPAKGAENFQKHIALTREAAAGTPKPDLIVWPETMVPAEINPEILNLEEGLLPEEGRKIVEEAKGYDRQLRDLATSLNVPLLVGAPGFIPNEAHGIRQNLTLLYLPGVGQAPMEYSKIHLVPFGEFIPFKTVPVVGSIVRYMTPIDFDYSLTPGKEWTRFEIGSQPVTTQGPGAGGYTFSTPICFEDTMPEPPRQMSWRPGSEGGKTDFLANVSNDGWFYFVELDQHLQADQLRAVENRIAIARSVNTGDSGFVDSNGRIMKLVTDSKTGSSIGAIGTAAETLPIDSRVSLFTRIGDLLPIVCGVLSTLIVAYTYARPRRAA